MSTCPTLVTVQQSTTEELLEDSAQLFQELFQARQQANYWKAQFQRSKGREAKHRQQIQELQAKIKQLEHQLFGKKSEKKHRSETSSPPTLINQEAVVSIMLAQRERPRGQQPDNPAPKRRSHDHLPIIEDPRDLPEDQKQCPRCGLPYQSFPGTLAGGLQRIAPMQEPIYRAIQQHCQAATRWHADDTGWPTSMSALG